MASKTTGERMRVAVDRATLHDVSGIYSLLLANKKDTSLVQRSRKDIQANIRDFVVATDDKGRLLGCTALHFYTPTMAEETSLALSPLAHGKGIGPRLIEATETLAKERGVEKLLLVTPRPEYFARLGYKRVSWLRLPKAVLTAKLRQVMAQSPSRWIPYLFWQSNVMERRALDGDRERVAPSRTQNPSLAR